jgi:XisI protein
MDRLRHYRTLIKSHVTHVAELINRDPEPGVETLCVFDEATDQYLLVRTGWSGSRRIRGITLYVRLHDGKIRVEEDWTDDGIVAALRKAGVPPSDLVLAFHSPEKRRRTERAAV